MKSSGRWHRKLPSTNDPYLTDCRCRFFIWDFLSFYKYHETLSLARQNTLEGKGGKKFVRLQQDSRLEKWYPQLRQGILKTDGCALCGYSYKDHLLFRWHCRTKKGDVSEFDRFMRKNVANCDFELCKGYSFHKIYVQEVGKNTPRRTRDQEVRESKEGGFTFMVPRFNPLADGNPKSIGSVLLLTLARIQSLVKLEDMICLSKIE